MGEIKTWTDKTEYIDVLNKEIRLLKSRFDPNQEGTGHYNTAINVLQDRVEELKRDLSWPFPHATD